MAMLKGSKYDRYSSRHIPVRTADSLDCTDVNTFPELNMRLDAYLLGGGSVPDKLLLPEKLFNIIKNIRNSDGLDKVRYRGILCEAIK